MSFTERAFISVADKTDLPLLAATLARNYELLAYGKTAQVIEQKGIPLVSIRDAFSYRLNPSREQLAVVIANQVRKQEVAKPIGLVCVGIKPLPENPIEADIDIGGPLIITAALEAGCMAITRIDQYPEAIERQDAGDFDDPLYSAQLAVTALGEIATYNESIIAQFGAPTVDLTRM